MKLSLHVFDATGSTLLYNLPLWEVIFVMFTVLGICRIVAALYFARHLPRFLRKTLLPLAAAGVIGSYFWVNTLLFFALPLMVFMGASTASVFITIFWWFISLGAFHIGTKRGRMTFSDVRFGEAYRD